MVTLEHLVSTVKAECAPRAEDHEIVLIVRATITGLGFHVSPTGEVCDPRPKLDRPLEQNGVRWSGSGRRRR